MGKTQANLTEEEVTELTLDALKENPEGVTEYPVLEFDQRALGLLSSGVKETLRYSEIRPRGGVGYRIAKRAFDIVVSALALVLLAIPMGIVALAVYLEDKGSPIFSQARLTENGAEGKRDRRVGIQERKRSAYHQGGAVYPENVAG